MIYRAKKSFCGAVTMKRGEEKEITDKTVISDLLRAGYIEETQPKKEKKPAKG